MFKLFKGGGYVKGFNLKRYKEKKNYLANLLPYACALQDGVILLKNGAVMKCYSFTCPDLGSASESSINSVSMHFNRAIKLLGSSWAVQFEVQRVMTSDYPASVWENEAGFIIDKCREKNFQKVGEHFISNFYLTFTKELDVELKEKAQRFFIKKDRDQKELTIDTVGVRKQIDDFIVTCEKTVSALKNKLSINEMSCEEAVTYIHSGLSTKWHDLILPNRFMFLDRILTDDDLQLSMPMKLGKFYIPIIAINDFPLATQPAMFDALNAANIEYRWSTRFICLSKTDALKEIERYQKKHHGARKSLKQLVAEEATKMELGSENEGALTLEQDAKDAYVECYTDAFGFGFYTSCLECWDEDYDVAQQKAQYLESLISACGFTSRQETYNAFEAWLGMLAGNVYANVRRPLVSTGNLSHVIPLSSIWQGTIKNQHLDELTGNGAPLITCNTEYATPFFFNLHVKDVGHTFVFGPTGAGKSTLLSLIESQFLRYKNANVIIFDKDRSARGNTMAHGGIYVEPGKDDIAFQPLKELETTVDLLWASEFIECLLVEQNIVVSPQMKEAIRTTISLMKDIDLNARTLSTFSQYVNYVNPDTGANDIKIGISPYVKGGQYGDIFDADSTSMPLSKWIMIEMGSLMKLSSQAVTPALMFLFKYLEKIWMKDNTSPTLMVLDEAWIFLSNPVFEKTIENWLLTLRKAHVACVFATQNIASVKKSSIAEIISQQCLTKIYLADNQAMTPAQKEGYMFFGLDESEIKALQNATMKKDYYYTSPLGKRMFQLDLDKTQLAIFSPEHDFLDLLETQYGRNTGKPLVKDILLHNNISYDNFFKE